MTANVHDRLVSAMPAQSDRPAVIHGDRSLSFLHLVGMAAVESARFAEQGVRPGDRVAFFVKPGLRFFAQLFGLFRVGAVPILLDVGMGLGRVGSCLRTAEPKYFLGVWQARMAKWLLGWPPQGGNLDIRPLGMTQLDRFLGAAAPPAFAAGPDDPAAILFTSGSTGPAKGVLYTHGMFNSQIDAVRDLYGIEPGEIDLPTFPLFALFGPVLGMTVVLPQMDFSRPGRVNPRVIRGAARRHRPTTMFGSPALLDRVARDGADKAEDRPFAGLKRLLSAGAPVPPHVLERWAGELTLPAQVHTPYGATEALPVASIGSAEVLGETASRTAEGAGTCVGRPVPGLELRIIRIDDGPIANWADDLVLPQGEIGEVAVKAPWVTREYVGLPEKTALAKIKDGADVWHRMGDVGYLDDQGRLWYCGRKAHRVVLPDGETLFSEQVEGYFNAQLGTLAKVIDPAPTRTALVGVVRGGERRAALVLEGREIVRFNGWASLLRQFADGHPACRRLADFLLFPGRFPVDRRHNAKIEREKLAAWAQAGEE